MDQRTLSRPVHKALNLLLWVLTFIVILTAIGLILQKRSTLSILSFFLIAALLMPALSGFWKRRVPFLAHWVTKTVVLFILLVIAGIGLPKSLPSQAKPVAKIQPAQNKPRIADNPPVKRPEPSDKSIAENPKQSVSKEIPGIKPPDIYLSFEEKGYTTDKEISSDLSIWTNRHEARGISYTVKTFCDEGVYGVSEVRLTATRTFPQYNKVTDMKPFLKFGCSISYDGADVKKIYDFIDQNFYKDKASIVISGVRFTIYVKTEWARMIEIEVDNK